MANDHYSVLGVPSDAELPEIETAYKSLILKFEPKRETDTNAAAKAARIEKAFTVLADSASRNAYDSGVTSISDWKALRRTLPRQVPLAPAPVPPASDVQSPLAGKPAAVRSIKNAAVIAFLLVILVALGCIDRKTLDSWSQFDKWKTAATWLGQAGWTSPTTRASVKDVDRTST